MTHPTPPLSDEDLLLDDEDVILLTDEIPPEDNYDAIAICQLADPSEPREILNLSDTTKEKSAIVDLGDVIEPSDFKTEFPPDFSISEADILNFELDDSLASDLFDLEPKTTTRNTTSFDGLVPDADTDIKESSAILENGEIFPLDISPSSLADELSNSLESASDTATSIPLSASDISPISEAAYQADDLQRLIDEVIHDSQAPARDFSGISPEISKPKDSPVVNDDLTSLSQEQIDAALERVIRNLFAERIENILDEVITTTVNREIENLKTVLLDSLTSGKTVYKATS
jgi:hypothetical protein